MNMSGRSTIASSINMKAQSPKNISVVGAPFYQQDCSPIVPGPSCLLIWAPGAPFYHKARVTNLYSYYSKPINYLIIELSDFCLQVSM